MGKRLFFIELERAFRGIGMKVALLVGMIISMEHVIRVVLPAAINPLRYFQLDYQVLPTSVFDAWIGGSTNYEYELFIRLIPILAVLPFGVSYYLDCTDGQIKNYVTRVKKSTYLIVKYLVTFLTGGIVATLPLILNLFITAGVLPSLVWPTGYFPMNANGMWSSIYFLHPYLYFFMEFILQFFVSGAFATIALVVSRYVNNRFIVMLFPFVLAGFLNALTRWSGNDMIRGMAPYRFLSISQVTYNNLFSYILFLLITFLVSIGLFYLKGNKDETI